MSMTSSNQQSSSFPPPYTVVVSPRAKYARLKMMPHEGLVVVLPKGFNNKEIPALLQRHEAWIREISAQLDAHRPEPQPVTEHGLPSSIAFPHFADEWSVEYRQSAIGEVEMVERSGNTLLISGDVANAPLCRQLMASWLKHRAKKLLIPLFAQLAAQHGFSYGEAKVRLLHSRWGSYASNGVITLNTKLLFLPEHLIHHIMVHELCHTVHPNHSRSFWALVQQHDPLWQLHRRDMESAWKYVPAWVSEKS